MSWASIGDPLSKLPPTLQMLWSCWQEDGDASKAEQTFSLIPNRYKTAAGNVSPDLWHGCGKTARQHESCRDGVVLRKMVVIAVVACLLSFPLTWLCRAAASVRWRHRPSTSADTRATGKYLMTKHLKQARNNNNKEFMTFKVISCHRDGKPSNKATQSSCARLLSGPTGWNSKLSSRHCLTPDMFRTLGLHATKTVSVNWPSCSPAVRSVVMTISPPLAPCLSLYSPVVVKLNFSSLLQCV